MQCSSIKRILWKLDRGLWLCLPEVDHILAQLDTNGWERTRIARDSTNTTLTTSKLILVKLEGQGGATALV